LSQRLTSSSEVMPPPAPGEKGGASAGLRTPANTWCPAAASRSAVARPIPDDAPVTTVCGRVHVLFMAPPA
jgi:hypothetical protein